MATKWTEHVKEYASKKGISYGDAMKNEECKTMYSLTKKDINVEITKPNKPVKTPKNPKVLKEEVKIEETPKEKKPTKKNKSI